MMSDANDLGSDPNAIPINESKENESNPINFSGESIDSSNPDDPMATNSAENLIPIDKIKNGWLVFSSYLLAKSSAAAEVVQEKIVTSEIYNSETMKKFRESASENWEKTTTAAAPYWEKTKNTVVQAAEITKEKAIVVAEAAKPTIDTVSLAPRLNLERE
jgi:hypothetical protein